MKLETGNCRRIGFLFGIFLFIFYSDVFSQTSSEQLSSIISEVEGYQSYNRKDFPLGRYLESIEKTDAAFAQKQLERLNLIDVKESL